MQVVFSRSNNGDLSGKVTWLSDEEPKAMKKIVFLAGYKPDKQATWKGALPEDGEEWDCELVRDTNPDDAKKGALIVHLRVRVTATTELRPTGQSVGGFRRHNLVTKLGNREIVTSDYRAENETTKALRKCFILACEGLAEFVLLAVQEHKRHDVRVLGVDVTDVYIEENTLCYRVDNIKVKRPLYKIFEEIIVRGNRVVNLYQAAKRLGIPRIDSDVAIFPTAVGDFQLRCDATAYNENAKLEIVGVTSNGSQRVLVLVATTPWGLRAILEHPVSRLWELPITEAQMTAAQYLICQE